MFNRKNLIEKSEKQKKEKLVSKIKKLFLFFLTLFFFVIGTLFIWISTLEIPNIDEIRKLKIEQSTKIYDRSGKVLLYNLYGDEKRTIISSEKMSENIKNATIAIEDKDFYTHSGIKISSIIKSAWENFFDKRKYRRGGSTITQQVIKNTLLTRKKSYTRKIKEAILAYKLEKVWDKEKILELYLNESPYGGIIYGIEEASLFYFDKHASELGVAESAYLAAMPQAPSTYSPYGKNKDKLDSRKNLILSLMKTQGFITESQYEEAKNELVEFSLRITNSGIKAPHFVMYVIKKLEETYGRGALISNGYKIITTLDYKLQERIQKIVFDIIAEKGEKFNVSNASVVAIEPKSGNIIAMIGSRDYFDKNIDGKFNVSISKRQPGSSFKPIVYLTAFQNGYTPETVLWDTNTEFNLKCNPKNIIFILQKEKSQLNEEEKSLVEEDKNYKIKSEEEERICYRPRNFDSKFKGPIQMKNSLPESRNIPSIKTLYLVGVDKAIKNAKLFGIKSLTKEPKFYGLNLVLGGGEVKLLNLTSTYGTFSAEGIRVEPNSILSVLDSNEEKIYEYISKKERVIEAKYVQNLNKILSDNSLKYPTFGENSVLYFTDRNVASKTGTTNNNRDSWTIGYDYGNVALGVWVGNNDNTPALKNPGGKITYQIWRQAMGLALTDYVSEDFPKAPVLIKDPKPVLRGVKKGGVVIPIDTKTGILATEKTPKEFIKEIIIPSYHSILHWVDKNNPSGDVPIIKDSAYIHWESGIQEWVRENYDEIKNNIEMTISELIDLTQKTEQELSQ